ncbi:MAG: hypothetical protein ACUVSA_13910 [Desulfosoma sp.]
MKLWGHINHNEFSDTLLVLQGSKDGKEIVFSKEDEAWGVTPG